MPGNKSYSDNESTFDPFSTSFQLKAWTVLGTAGIVALAASRFKVAMPNQVLIKTGLGVKTPSGLSLHSSTVMWPFQKVVPISIAPMTLKTRVLGMTKERIPLNLPFVVTVGPKMPEDKSSDLSCLTNYARLLSQKEQKEVMEMIEAILAGESRILTAALGADTIFQDRSQLKHSLADEVNKILAQLGLHLVNLNIEELHDDEASGSSFFRQQRQKALSQVEAEAKIAVAVAKKHGTVGEKQQEQETRIQVAQFEADTQKAEFERKQQIALADANFQVAKAELDRQAAVAQAESKAASERRKLELQKDVEIKRADAQIEELRAEDLAQKSVEAEVRVRETKGQTDAKKLEAENAATMQIIAAKAAADALRFHAEAQLFARQQEAAGLLALSEAEAKGKEAVLAAEANGLRQKVQAAGGPENYAVQAIISENTLPQIAKEQAAAVKGMEPDIHIWSQGGEEAGAGTKVISDLVRNLPPLLDSLKTQTGIDLPALMNQKLGGGKTDF